jgi:hypothetical protein
MRWHGGRCCARPSMRLALSRCAVARGTASMGAGAAALGWRWGGAASSCCFACVGGGVVVMVRGGKALGSEGMVAGDARKQDGSTPLGVLVWCGTALEPMILCRSCGHYSRFFVGEGRGSLGGGPGWRMDT